MPTAGPRRGRPALVDRTRIALAVLEVGPDGCTLSALAAHLGVHHSTLYGHVRDRDDALAAAAALVAAEIAWPDPDLPWRVLLTACGEAFWAACLARPGAAELILRLKAPPAVVIAQVERVTAGLRRAGFRAADAVVAVDLVVELVLTTAATMRRLDRPAQLRAWAADPAMTALIRHERGAYPEKLEIVLDGLATRLTPAG